MFLFPTILMSSTHMDNNSCDFWWTWTSSSFLSHSNPDNGWPTSFRSKGTTGSSIASLCFDLRLGGRVYPLAGALYLAVAIMWVPLTRVLEADTASLASPAMPGVSENFDRGILLLPCYLRSWCSLLREHCIHCLSRCPPGSPLYPATCAWNFSHE